jgi:hypothetical protein
MPPLKPELRKDLERVIIKARNLVVADVTDRLKELNAHEGKRGALSDAQAKLRIRLRAHGKQIGDIRNSQSETQQTDRLVQECAYGSELNVNQLPSLVDLESKGRHAVQEALERATSNCTNKYQKGKRSFQVLAVLTRSTLEEHLPSFVRDMRILEEKLS